MYDLILDSKVQINTASHLFNKCKAFFEHITVGYFSVADAS